ncbi:unnamed protein product [Arctia plantaginis]|uniref:Uncharacterized protein n=1 Tax=Arctia plantaginis TaxID=874455 RepID=A0A8S1BHE6_ARCPL|nr:unnamed protein product [Arctia plantaginis]CAB3258366.1 unnamed protein product [Arctia plantaginis]
MITIISRIVVARDILSSRLHNELRYITGRSKLKPQNSTQRRTLSDEAYEEVLSDVFDDYLSPDMLANKSSHGAPPLYQAEPACRCCACSRAFSRLLAQETVLNECEQKSEELTEVITENAESERSSVTAN